MYRATLRSNGKPARLDVCGLREACERGDVLTADAVVDETCGLRVPAWHVLGIQPDEHCAALIPRRTVDTSPYPRAAARPPVIPDWSRPPSLAPAPQPAPPEWLTVCVTLFCVFQAVSCLVNPGLGMMFTIVGTLLSVFLRRYRSPLLNYFFLATIGVTLLLGLAAIVFLMVFRG